MDPTSQYDAAPSWPPIDDASHPAAGEDEQRHEQQAGAAMVDPSLDPVMEDHLRQLRHDLAVESHGKEPASEAFDDGMGEVPGSTAEHPSGSTGAQHPSTTPLSFHNLVHPAPSHDDRLHAPSVERASLPPIQYTPGPFNPYPDPAGAAVSAGSTSSTPHPHALLTIGLPSLAQRQEQPVASSSRLAPLLGESVPPAANATPHKRPSAGATSSKAAGKARTNGEGASDTAGEEGDAADAEGAGDKGDDTADHKRRKLKRAEQNRQAQRAFRERREKHIADLEAKARTLHLAQVNEADAVRRLRLANATIGELRAENANLRETVERLGAELAAAAVTAAMGGDANGPSAAVSASTAGPEGGAVDDQEMEGAHDVTELGFAPEEHHDAELSAGIDQAGAGELVDEPEVDDAGHIDPGQN